MTNLDSILKSRDIANKGPSIQGYGFSSGQVWMWELDYKESWGLKNWCFWTVVLEKTLESPLDCQEIQPVHPKGDQPGCSFSSVQFSSVIQSCPTLCDPMNRSTPGLPVHHQLPEFTQTHVHRVGDAIQQSHPVIPFSSCPQSLPASGSFPMSQLFISGGQSMEFQLQHHSFQWTLRTDLL